MPSFPIQLKRNGTAAATPSSLLHGEVALNYADGKLFWKDASNVIQSFTFQAYALSSHTHAASDITSGTLDAARLPLATTIAAGAVIVGTGLGVSSGTVSVAYGMTSGTACQGNDARLSDTRTPTDGSVTTAKIANDAVTYAKIQNVSATDRLLGRSSAGSGDVEEILCTSFGRALLDDNSHSAQLTTLGAAPLASPTFTGTVSVPGLTATAAILADDLSSANSVVYSFDGDPNTGVGRAGADILTLVTAGSERVRVDASGNVGIGGAAFYALDVQRTSANAILNVQTTTSGNAQLRIECAGNASSTITQNRTSNNLEITNGSTGSIVFTNNGSERVRVDASGRLGIGISPSTLLHLNSLGVLRLQTGSVTMDCTPTAGATDSFVWNTSANAAYRWSMNGTERVRIESDGKLYAYSTYETTVGGTNRDLFIDSGGLIGYVSSIRASKTNIAAIEDVSWLRNLTPVSFHYRKRNEDGTYSDEADGTLDYGLIAEEVEPVAPEMCFYDVVDGEPQLRGVHYSKLITPMLRYIQQLEQRIAALEERLNHA